MKKNYDVVIIGGGMAGASLACALAETDMQIAVVEAVSWQSDSQPSYDVRTISLSHGSRNIYESMGIWSRIDADAVCPIHQIHVSDRGHAGFSHLHRSDVGVEALGYVIENRALGAALMAHLEPFNNVEIISPATVVDASRDEDFVNLSCDAEGKELQLKAKLLVLADGGRSGLRERLDFKPLNDDYGQTAVVCNVTPGQDHQNCAYERFTPAGPLAVLPMNGERCWCVWAVDSEDADSFNALNDEDFLQRFQQQFGDRLGRFSRVGKRYAYPLSRSLVDKHIDDRVILVGNAAHTVHPVAAQGFNLGLRDVAWLAEILSEATVSQQDVGAAAVLQKYDDVRSRDTKKVTAFTHSMIKIFTSRLPPVVLGRNIALHVTDMLPELKSALLKRTMGLTGRQSRLARGLSLAPLSSKEL